MRKQNRLPVPAEEGRSKIRCSAQPHQQKPIAVLDFSHHRLLPAKRSRLTYQNRKTQSTASMQQLGTLQDSNIDFRKSIPTVLSRPLFWIKPAYDHQKIWNFGDVLENAKRYKIWKENLKRNVTLRTHLNAMVHSIVFDRFPLQHTKFFVNLDSHCVHTTSPTQQPFDLMLHILFPKRIATPIRYLVDFECKCE